MTFDLTGITSNPTQPIKNSTTTFNTVITGTGMTNTNWIIRPSLSINNQLNGGLWGGGRGFVKMSCEFFITDQI